MKQWKAIHRSRRVLVFVCVCVCLKCKLLSGIDLQFNSPTNSNVDWQTLTLWPAGTPGSHTAAESMFTSRSCTLPILSPMLSNPSWRSLRLSMFGLMSNLRTFPKLWRNWSTMRQSENALPDNTRPGIRDNSGSGWRETQRFLSLNTLCFFLIF